MTLEQVLTILRQGLINPDKLEIIKLFNLTSLFKYKINLSEVLSRTYVGHFANLALSVQFVLLSTCRTDF